MLRQDKRLFSRQKTLSVLAAGDMSAAGTGQLSSVETGKLSVVETVQMSAAVETKKDVFC